MTVTLNKAYNGLTAGSVVELSAELEAALVAQGLASSGGTLSSGAQTRTEVPVMVPALVLTAVVAAAASTVVISNANITANSKAFAQIAQAAADGTFTSIPRVSCAAGAVTITGNAAATAAVEVSVVIFL